MTDDHPQHDKEVKQKILEDVDNTGWHLGLIEADNYLPAFVYTIGMFKNFKHPEIICFGLRNEVMATIINHAGELVRDGGVIIPYIEYAGYLEGYNIQFIPVEKDYYQDYVGYAGWFYNMTFNFPLLQLVWPDKDHNFPWDENFKEEWKRMQPLLDRNTDFKFYEDRRLGVYTTKQVFKGDPILRVYHNEDGAWQFHASDNPHIDDSMLVALEEITDLDSSVNELFRLQYGWCAWRDDKDDDWKYKEFKEEE